MPGRTWFHRLGMALALLVLWLVFRLYRQGDFLVDLSNQLWSCF